MKKIFFLLISMSVIFMVNAQKPELKVKMANAPYSAQIEKLLKRMTLEEKVGQMTQITADALLKGKSDTLMRKGIVDYKIGSVLNTWQSIAHNSSEWNAMVARVQQFASQTRLKIPVIYGIDAIHGVTYTIGSTLFPQEIAQAATFNRELVRRGGEICAYEARACGLPWNFSPVLDLGIDFRWPRFWETFGEDPYLTSAMATAITKGYQGENPSSIDKNHVVACAKHFLGYSVPVSGKDRTPALIPENVLREYHLPSFKAAVDAGIGSVMVNSGLINGIPVHASYFYLTKLLKQELGFKGVVVTDWGDIENLHRRDHLASSQKEAVRMAVNAGIDMSMVPSNYKFCDYLIELVKEGAVPMSRIDDAVRRILKMKFELNLFRHPISTASDYPLFGSAEFEKASYQAASEAITLLKNDQKLLPLNKNSKVLVCGPNANSMRTLNGGWSYSWQGERVEQFAGKYNTILEAIQNKIGKEKVLYAPGVVYQDEGAYWQDKEEGLDRVKELAKTVDYIVLCLGENSYAEKPGDTNDLNLSENQTRLALELTALGKPVIVVLNEGRPRIINKFADSVPAILMAYLPGNFGGDALADILFGDVNPSGKLPFTYPRYPQSMVNYWHKYSEEQVKTEGMYNYESDYCPLYEFGHGLSYTTFEYSNLKLSKTEIQKNDSITVSIDVTNIGNLAGKEAVLLYLSDLYASLAPDMKRLKGFEKIELAPGETKTVLFSLTQKEMSFVNINNETIVEPGEFEVRIGNQKARFNLK